MDKNDKKEIQNLKIAVFFFIAVSIGLSIYLGVSYNNQNYVSLEECNKPVGEFAVQINSGTDSVLNLCGNNGYGYGNSPCIFNVNDLSDAVKECNKRQKICNKFLYSEGPNQQRRMTIVDLNAPLYYSQNTVGYVRQTGITYR